MCQPPYLKYKSGDEKMVNNMLNKDNPFTKPWQARLHKALKAAVFAAVFVTLGACKNVPNTLPHEDDLSMRPDIEHFIIGGYGTSAESGIQLVSYDTNAQLLAKKQLVAAAYNASYLTWLPQQRRLYSIATDEKKSPLLLQYSWNKNTQKFDLRESLNIDGRGICHINTNRDQSKVAVANYTSGDIGLFDITDTNTSALGKFNNVGKSITARQQSSHLHYVGWSNDNRYLYTSDLGTDEILVFDGQENALSRPLHRIKLDAGDGPRHLAFHPNQNIVFSLNELSNSITVYKQSSQTGKLDQLHKTLLHPQKQGETNNIASAIRIDKSGKHLYAAVRGEDMLYAYEIKEKGKLSLINKVSSGGKHPRDFNFSSSQDYILVANQHSDTLNLIKRELSSGKLIPTSISLSITKPSYVSAFGDKFVSTRTNP